MDILVSLNIRKRSFSGQYDVNKCVICQENKTDALEHKKQRGIQTLKERASQRQKIRDVQYYEAIDQLEKLHTSNKVFCHRKCYSNLPSFLSLPENKEELAFFLATELIWQAPEGKVVVTGGGFITEDQADSNDKSLNLDNLKATHEEADMRMILHMLHCKNVSNF
jgi:hypothetical protein